MILVITYLELLLHVTTVDTHWGAGLLYTLVFSICAGLFFTLLFLLIKNKWTRRIVKTIFVFVFSLPYIIEYFIFKEFHLLYDLETMLAGAGDAAADYSKEIMDLIFCWDGISHIFLFNILPTALYGVITYFALKYLKVPKSSKKQNARAKRRNPEVVRDRKILVLVGVAAMIFLFFTNILFINLSKNYSGAYGKEYEFQSTTSDFGLITGFRLDIKNMIFGGKADFGGGSSEISKKEDPKKEEEPIVYGKNEISLDFDALRSKASSEQKKLLDYVEGLTSTSQNKYTGLFKGKNLIFISAEAFSGYCIDPQLTPTLYRLATKGINFTDYYQPSGAGTTGGEYHNITGLIATAGGKSMKNLASHYNYYTMGMRLNEQGYYGQAFHNNTYTYYDRDKTHTKLGYSAGYMGYGNGMEQYVTKHWPESDTEMFKGTWEIYKDKQPFNIYYMSVSGHSNYYPQTANYWTKQNWRRVANLNKSDMVKGYIAAQLEFEDALTFLVGALETAGIADNTVIVISADHYPYGMANTQDGSSPTRYLNELYGHTINDSLDQDSNRLIIWSGCLEKEAPIVVDDPVMSLDILPTLFNLFGIEYDSRLLPGRDVFSDATPLVFDMKYDWKTDLGTYISATKTFTPKSPDTVVPENYVSTVKSVVSKKMTYCRGVLNTDFWRLLFKK